MVQKQIFNNRTELKASDLQEFRAGGMVQWVRLLLSKVKDLYLDPQNLHKAGHCRVCICNPQGTDVKMGGQSQESPQKLAGQLTCCMQQ